jgi:hypothetical protein
MSKNQTSIFSIGTASRRHFAAIATITRSAIPHRDSLNRGVFTFSIISLKGFWLKKN